MKLFFQYCSFGFSNSYIIGDDNPSPDNQKTAIIIDPGSMEKVTLDTIENNNFNLKAVFITHDHMGHIQGLRTLKRIYNADIYAVNPVVMEHRTNMVKDGDKLDIAPFLIEVISIPGHSSDSVVYKIGTLLFSGDVLTAGLVGSTASAYGATTQMNKLRTRLLSLPGDYFVLPGHGPPSTLEAERRFNTDIFHFEETRIRRPSFRFDL
ncbi:MAG: MBL fold metallo-hydrolase [Treponema sp.]|jgi:glyoxylase-like metal-dependent hydrolase (beta-lactamase superfamily II)|nr:MBL fold metallo-hydrolase [Treponema sp.]